MTTKSGRYIQRQQAGGDALETTTINQIKSSDLKTFLKNFLRDSDFNSDNFMNLVSDTDENTALRILARFTESLNDIKNIFNQSLTTHDFEPVWMSCHKVSSSAELLGFIDFSNEARRLGLIIKDVNSDKEYILLNVKNLSLNAELLRAKILEACSYIKHYL